MQKKSKVMKRRYKGLFAMMLGLILVVGWFQMPEMIHATGNAFPESTVASTSVYNSGSEVESEYEEGEEEGEEELSTPVTKPGGHVSVTIADYIYGGTASIPQVVSNTGNISTVTLTYKVTGADDSTYTSQMPTEVGNYTVQAVLPEDTYYSAAIATDTFTISYLNAPSPAYELVGTPGENGWFTSEVTILPPQGYELSVGNRNSFGSDGYVISEETNRLSIYLKKTSTGEMTDVISIANLRIDADAPEINNVDTSEEYYVDSMEVNFQEDNFDSVSVNGEIVTATEYSDGQYGFAIESGMKRMTYTITVTDEAGNETEVSIVMGPAWLEDGVVGEGEYYLETGVEYSFPENSQWKKEGDSTVYAGGVSFYASKEGTVTFSKD